MKEIVRKPIEGLEQYANKWVAIYETETERKVVGSSEDAVGAIQEAQQNGYEEVILQKVFPFDVLYMPSVWNSVAINEL